jgi:hypothetical protein
MLVFLLRMVRSTDHRNTVKGRVQILHSRSKGALSIWMYGFGPRQGSQTEGKSVVSRPARLGSDFGGIVGVALVKVVGAEELWW